MDPRHGQFPATFPDTFKNFFSILNDEEDHVELFSNLLEDKVIPKSNNCKFRKSNESGGNSREYANTTNCNRSNSFRVQRTRKDYCKHMKYCCLHQSKFPHEHNIEQDYNISDDEKRKKHFGKLEERIQENESGYENCEDSDTISTCSSSNNTTSYSCLLRNNKEAHHGIHRSNIGLHKNTSETEFGSSCGGSGTNYLQQNVMSSSSTPLSKICFHEKKNIVCSCNPVVAMKASTSPVFHRRRASSIAAPHISPEHRFLKADDQISLKSTLEELPTRVNNSKSPVHTSQNTYNKAINEGNSSYLPSVKQKQRMRTASMPGENRKPRLADTRRAAIHCADMDLEYYRLRSFSITSHGICNLGDSMRSRRSRSINSVTSIGTPNSGKVRNNSNASQVSNEVTTPAASAATTNKTSILAYKIAMLGETGVGKTALTYQFTTSDYICAYDLSLDDDYGQKTVSVLLDGYETDLEIIDHPACEMSTEAFCSTYNIDLFVVVYSVVDKKSFKTAEKILHYLKESEMLLIRGAILVGNKTDLERHREVPRQAGRRLAKEVACKFIETSSGLDHNVNELLVGIVAQVKLNPLRINNLTEKQKLSLNTTIQKHRKTTERPFQKPLNLIRKKDIEEHNNLNIESNKIVFSKVNNTLIKSNVRKHDQDGGSCSSSSTQDNNVCLLPSSNNEPCCSSPKTRKSYESSPQTTPKKTNLLDEKSESKMSIRTKYFLTSFLKFKRSLRAKRRNSNSCSDLFVI